MRACLAATLFLATSALAFGQSNLVETGIPSFKSFTDACRDGDTMRPECEAVPMGAYAERTGLNTVTCNWATFWKIADEFDSDAFRSLPWQYGIEFILDEPGVCTAR